MAPPYSLAILPFDNLSKHSALAWLRLGFVEMLTTDLATFPNLEVVSRQELGEVLREQWLQHRGVSPDLPAVRIGRLMGARYLLKGSYHVDRSNVVLEVHLIDVERGTIARSTRLSGSQEDIPELERRLANHIGAWFPLEKVTSRSAQRGQNEYLEGDDESFDVLRETVPNAEDPTMMLSKSHDAFSHSALPAIDSLLYLERVQRVREAAVLLADRIWERGVQITVMPVEYHQAGGKDTGPLPVIRVPVVVRFDLDRLQDMGTLVAREFIVSKHTAPRVALTWLGNDNGARALFRQRLIEPRRLFVRAKDSAGMVIAVSSPWNWRLDHHVQAENAGRIILPAGRILSGEAVFPIGALAQNGQDLSFDAVIARVPRERRSVIVELVKSRDDQPEIAEAVIDRMMTTLTQWLQEQWNPVVWESVPVTGYLPGNRRSAVFVIRGTDGIVQHVRVLRPFPEVALSHDLSRLHNRLIGVCLVHHCSKEKRSVGQPLRFRVQLELIKDIRALGLGRRAIGQ